MPRLTLDPLPYALLSILVNEGGMSFGSWFARSTQLYRCEAVDVLAAAQVLADYLFVDVKHIEKNVWLESLTPEDLRRTYGHLDSFTVTQVIARGTTADPLYFAASHLGIAEHAYPGYAERAALPPGSSNNELPPADELPTLPLE